MNHVSSTWLLSVIWVQSHVIPCLAAATEGYFVLLTANLETPYIFYLALKHGTFQSV